MLPQEILKFHFSILKCAFFVFLEIINEKNELKLTVKLHVFSSKLIFYLSILMDIFKYI